MDQIQFICSQCGLGMAAEPGAVGFEVECPNCHTKLVVPAKSAPPPPEPAAPPPTPASPGPLRLKKAPPAPPTTPPLSPIVQRQLREAAAPPPKPPFPTALVVKIALVVLLLVAAFLLYLHLKPKPHLVTRQNYDRLRPGMTVEQTQKFLGRPTEKTFIPEEASTLEYLSVALHGEPDRYAFLPVQQEISTATDNVRLPRNVAQAKGQDTVTMGRELAGPDGAPTHSKVGFIHFEFGNQPLRYWGAVRFLEHEDAISGATNQLRLLCNGALGFERTRDKDPRIRGRMMSWVGQEGRVIYANFATNLVFWAYQGPPADFATGSIRQP